MSLRENRQTPWHQQRALDGPLSPDHPDQVLTFLEWCKLNRISERPDDGSWTGLMVRR
jgi:hypothetical protein